MVMWARSCQSVLLFLFSIYLKMTCRNSDTLHIFLNFQPRKLLSKKEIMLVKHDRANGVMMTPGDDN